MAHQLKADAVKITYEESGYLLGRLLTLVDATFQDQNQREAHKSLVRREVKDWMVNLYRDQYPDRPEYHI